MQNNTCKYGVIMERNGRFLVGKQASSGFWGFFKGGQEGSESMYACAQRELWEEAGIRVEIERLKQATLLVVQRPGQYRYGYFLVHCDANQPPPIVNIDHREIVDARWCDLHELHKSNTTMQFSKITLAVLRKLRRHVSAKHAK